MEFWLWTLRPFVQSMYTRRSVHWYILILCSVVWKYTAQVTYCSLNPLQYCFVLGNLDSLLLDPQSTICKSNQSLHIIKSFPLLEFGFFCWLSCAYSLGLELHGHMRKRLPALGNCWCAFTVVVCVRWAQVGSSSYLTGSLHEMQANWSSLSKLGGLIFHKYFVHMTSSVQSTSHSESNVHKKLALSMQIFYFSAVFPCRNLNELRAVSQAFLHSCAVAYKMFT